MKSDFYNSIGVSFEQSNLYLKLTGFEMRYYAGLFNVPTRDSMLLLESVGLKGAAHKRSGTYSKGMKERLVFIRSLINNPEILFLDEPTGSLDPMLAKRIKEIIMELKKEGRTIFLTTRNDIQSTAAIFLQFKFSSICSLNIFLILSTLILFFFILLLLFYYS